MSTNKVNGARLVELREARMWTQEQLMETSGVGLRTIQRAEKGGSVSVETIKNLAATLEVEAHELVLPPDKDHQKPKQPDHVLDVLPRITTGKQLGRLADCDGYLFDHEEPETDKEATTLSTFLSDLQDYGEEWSYMGIADRIEAERAMRTMLSDLEHVGFWAFGKPRRQIMKPSTGEPWRWEFAYVVIKRPSYPGIVKKDGKEQDAVLPALFPKNPQVTFAGS